MIGLWIAARSYDKEQGPFRPFAKLVISRRLGSCMKAANRKKNTVLSTSVRVSVDPDGGWEAITEQLPHLHQVVDIVEDRESLSAVILAMDSLTEFERKCVIGVASGKSYLELGPPKKVDNTLARARRKLKAAIA